MVLHGDRFQECHKNDRAFMEPDVRFGLPDCGHGFVLSNFMIFVLTVLCLVILGGLVQACALQGIKQSTGTLLARCRAMVFKVVNQLSDKCLPGLHNLKISMETFSKRLLDFEAKRQELELQLLHTREENDQRFDAMSEKLGDALTAKDHQIQEFDDQNKKLREILGRIESSCNSKVDQAKAKANTTQRALEAANDRVANLEQAGKDNIIIISALQNEVKSANEKLDAIQRDLKATDKHIAEVRKVSEDNATTVFALEHERNAADENAQVANERVADLEKANWDTAVTFSELRDGFKSALEDIHANAERTLNLETAKDDQDATLSAIESEIKVLRDDTQAALSQNDSLPEMLDEVRKLNVANFEVLLSSHQKMMKIIIFQTMEAKRLKRELLILKQKSATAMTNLTRHLEDKLATSESDIKTKAVRATIWLTDLINLSKEETMVAAGEEIKCILEDILAACDTTPRPTSVGSDHTTTDHQAQPSSSPAGEVATKGYNEQSGEQCSVRPDNVGEEENFEASGRTTDKEDGGKKGEDDTKKKEEKEEEDDNVKNDTGTQPLSKITLRTPSDFNAFRDPEAVARNPNPSTQQSVDKEEEDELEDETTAGGGKKKRKRRKAKRDEQGAERCRLQFTKEEWERMAPWERQAANIRQSLGYKRHEWEAFSQNMRVRILCQMIKAQDLSQALLQSNEAQQGSTHAQHPPISAGQTFAPFPHAANQPYYPTQYQAQPPPPPPPPPPSSYHQYPSYNSGPNGDPQSTWSSPSYYNTASSYDPPPFAGQPSGGPTLYGGPPSQPMLFDAVQPPLAQPLPPPEMMSPLQPGPPPTGQYPQDGYENPPSPQERFQNPLPFAARSRPYPPFGRPVTSHQPHYPTASERLPPPNAPTGPKNSPAPHKRVNSANVSETLPPRDITRSTASSTENIQGRNTTRRPSPPPNAPTGPKNPNNSQRRPNSGRVGRNPLADDITSPRISSHSETSLGHVLTRAPSPPPSTPTDPVVVNLPRTRANPPPVPENPSSPDPSPRPSRPRPPLTPYRPPRRTPASYTPPTAGGPNDSDDPHASKDRAHPPKGGEGKQDFRTGNQRSNIPHTVQREARNVLKVSFHRRPGPGEGEGEDDEGRLK